jgi:hypothetical protein
MGSSCCLPKDPKCVAGWLIRLSFGLSLLFVGLAHYMEIEAFAPMVGQGLGPLGNLGELWAYIFPGLMVVGGVLLVLGQYLEVAVWTSGLALAAIPAGLTLKALFGEVALPDLMPGVINAFIWLLVFGCVVKCCCCDKKK